MLKIEYYHNRKLKWIKSVIVNLTTEHELVEFLINNEICVDDLISVTELKTTKPYESNFTKLYG